MTPNKGLYLVTGTTDMRKSIDGLSMIVAEGLELNPLSQAWFIFCNRQRDKLKILFWDTNGFWLYYGRLERGRFKWPNSAVEARTITITQRELNWLLSGLPLQQNLAHKPLTGKNVG
ncbi:transposase [Shewanella sairae]|uniref:Transposase n=1 Tax=Shewanella sairae TaxID=190310 RepID=A0ABQ4PQQ1_9GAMM|nr:IS66 family insertion sequence element accessory protein TnpB [Shewanella sairae]MCL1132380.1 IS66 family insertion sequence element accessory protein TnpB [Shewanella sairae]GIU51571.1 transposase [Shewanella sairae]